jgi:hypothetical protein
MGIQGWHLVPRSVRGGAVEADLHNTFMRKTSLQRNLVSGVQRRTNPHPDGRPEKALYPKQLRLRNNVHPTFETSKNPPPVASLRGPLWGNNVW